MQNKKILFIFGSKKQPITRFGEIDILSRACYFKGIELGYKKGNIFFEWPLNIEYLLTCQKEIIIPIRFINLEEIKLSDYDKILKLTDPNIFYESSPPLFNKDNLKERNHKAFLNYMNRYYIKYKTRPIYHIEKEEINEKYILVHIRKLNYSISRNPNLDKYKIILKLLKEKYKNYKIYMIGETGLYKEELKGLFDISFDYFKEFNDFLKLMVNSSLFIGCSSGPIQYAYSFEKPTIEIDIPKTINWSSIQDRYIGMGDYFSEKYWKNGLNGIYGDTVDYYMNNETHLKLFEDDKIDRNMLYDFISKWL